jgi:hypothetical protein
VRCDVGEEGRESSVRNGNASTLWKCSTPVMWCLGGPCCAPNVRFFGCKGIRSGEQKVPWNGMGHLPDFLERLLCRPFSFHVMSIGRLAIVLACVS